MRKLRRLSEIVTICAWTGKVKEQGNWISVEEFLRKRFGFKTSHGISKEAADEFKRELADLKEPERK